MKKLLLVVLAGLFISGCATIGHDFSVANVSLIQMGKTTQSEIMQLFGTPWRTGVDDGKRTWTYGKYKYSVFKEPSTQDLVIRFDDKGIVTSYTFNTTDIQIAEPQK